MIESLERDRMAEQAEEGWTERKSDVFTPTNSITGEMRAKRQTKYPFYHQALSIAQFHASPDSV